MKNININFSTEVEIITHFLIIILQYYFKLTEVVFTENLFEKLTLFTNYINRNIF